MHGGITAPSFTFSAQRQTRSFFSMVSTRRRSTARLNDEDPKPPAKRQKRRIHAQVGADHVHRLDVAAECAVEVAVEKLENDSLLKGKRKRKAKATERLDPSTFLPRVHSPWLIGAHVSSANGVENAVTNAASIGASSFALFVKSQRKWTSPDLTEESISEFKKSMHEYGYTSRMVLPHGSYLINLGNPNVEKREKSYTCFLDDLKRCEALSLDLYNFHPGSTVGQGTIEGSCALIAECINRAHKETSSVIVVLENMAGAGNIIGSDFSHLAAIIAKVEDKSRVGVCIDTCHSFAAGYNIKTKEGWERTIQAFDDTIGLKYLYGMHLNDSKTDHNSKKDRHENIGLGYLGLSAFHHILSDARTQGIPLILETPCFERPKQVWGKEIKILHEVSGIAAEFSANGIQSGLDFVNLTDQIKSAVKEAEKRSGRAKGKKTASRKTKGTETPEEDAEDEGEKEEN